MTSMTENIKDDKSSDSRSLEHLAEDFDEKVNLIQHAMVDDDHTQDNNKEVEDIFSQVNNHQARRPSLNNTNQIDLDTQQKDIPFDFNRFLEQMKSRSAKPIIRYFKSFLQAFDRRPWTLNEQIKIIQDFMEFIHVKMRENDIWKDMSDQEFYNAKEGMEKLVMNRLYSATFCSRTTDDKERDEIIHQKINIFRWIREKHLDIPETEHNEAFLNFAESELEKINNYKAPRDKLICILNCCKVIFGLIKQVEGDAGADKFLPILIYVIIRANPTRLVSNTQYIYRFRSIDQLQAEPGYYLTNLMGAIAFIENMEAKSLSISKEEFDSHIEQTVKELNKRPSLALDKEEINYDNTVYPSRSSASISTQSLLDSSKTSVLFEKGSQFAQKTIHKPWMLVEKMIQGFTEKSPPLPPRNPQKNDTYDTAPNLVNVPVESSNPTDFLPSSDSLKAQQDKDLQTLYDMFPNVTPNVCRIVFEASNGVLSVAADKLLEM